MPTPKDSPEAEPETFEAARARTLEVLASLGEHWRARATGEAGNAGAEAVAQAVLRVVEDSSELSEAGLAWSQETGLGYVLPSGALQCRPLAQSEGREGLKVPSAGGPVVPTHAALVVAPAPPCGYGVFATADIAKGTKLGEYLGEARRYDLWCDEIKARKVKARGRDDAVPFIREELYSAWTGNGPNDVGIVVDAFAAGNAMRFINCSCSPNATFTSFGRGFQKHARLEVAATRDIQRWEQLSVNYGWYFDDATLQDVRKEAIKAFNNDLADLRALGDWLRERSVDAPAAAAAAASAPGASAASAAASPGAAESVPAGLVEGRSEALAVLAGAVAEVRGPPGRLRSEPASFLRRFVSPDDVASLLEQGGCPSEPATEIQHIPDAVWPLYEVVGGDVVGIPCRCGMDPSLNAKGSCSGIIGRPLQAACNGRNPELANESEWLA